MSIELHTPGVDELAALVAALREWQQDDVPLQFHPGDLGWFQRFGAEKTAAATRVWTRGGRIVAMGMADYPDLIRMTTAPDLSADKKLARQVASDLSDPQRGILNDGEVFVEVPNGALIRDALLETGWQLGEEWTPLTRDLGAAVEEPGLRIEVVGPDQVADRVAVGRASFDNSTFCDQQWRSMAGGAAYADARCLVGYGERDTAVAMVTVWSAGVGKPGLIEPLGVHRDHRGHGYGRSICYAAAAALQEMGSSSVQVCTPSSNVVAVAAYVSAGLEKMPLRRDLRRGALSEATSKV